MLQKLKRNIAPIVLNAALFFGIWMLLFKKPNYLAISFKDVQKPQFYVDTSATFHDFVSLPLKIEGELDAPAYIEIRDYDNPNYIVHRFNLKAGKTALDYSIDYYGRGFLRISYKPYGVKKGHLVIKVATI
ncbi:hypothetical protein QM480_22320 [Flectobacillus sp. DC10W]|jgi:hypothetical protein|uniref:Uncharacterized protein n=1 Tax=Flectobacillus longus TaxID=2984207 RepID=A0ABT6YU32_9BACT|nr:hypothetical protein [Flectobacillus longus]MDI9867093.1 hypothetical protein [Flectobacillus longus]